MAWLDIDQLEAIGKFPLWSTRRFNLVRYCRSDYIDPHIPDLRTAIEQRLSQAGVEETPQKIMLLTHLQNWGLSFNPVSFYFCFDESGQVSAILSEINNTPWDERHTYIHEIPLADRQARKWRFDFEKAFHVSPFMPMNLRYHWVFAIVADRLTVEMQLYRGEDLDFDAVLALKLTPLTAANAWKLPLLYPFMTLKVLSSIYWQALRLWSKRIPFYSHPERG